MIDYRNKDIVIISGFSATLKSCLTNATKRTLIPSPNKFLNEMDKNCFKWNAELSPIATLLTQLFCIDIMKDQKLVVERSIFDQLFFLLSVKAFKEFQSEGDLNIDKLNAEFKDITRGHSIGVILMENRANSFIRTNVLNKNHWTRENLYKDLNQYRSMSDEFTTYVENKLRKYNYDYHKFTLDDTMIFDFIDNPNKYIRL